MFELISPGTFTNLKAVKDKDRSLRLQVLTLPVMAAIVLSLVYRQLDTNGDAPHAEVSLLHPVLIRIAG